ncbi:unnamed protein product [marine sediment metagenome]|uniref:Uncharacterized protein n=2 Tax=marine sediment metagenome TaxID=412755 RepID=X1KMX2_9ZZZZ
MIIEQKDRKIKNILNRRFKKLVNKYPSVFKKILPLKRNH